MKLNKRVLFAAFAICSGISAACAEENVEIIKTEDFNTSISGWTINSGDNFSKFTKLNNTLYYNGVFSTKKEVSITQNGFLIDNCELTLDFNVQSGKYFGLLLRVQEDSSAYCVRVYPSSGKVVLLKRINKGSYSEIKSGICSIGMKLDHKLQVTLIGPEISVAVDGKTVLTAEDKSLESGYIGIEGGNGCFSVDNIVAFRYTDRSYEWENKDIKPEKVIYVAADGNDNGDGTDSNPYQTLERAKSAAKLLNADNTPVTVIFKGGEYKFSDTVTFTEENSGSKYAPIKYKAAEGERVVFSGAASIDISQFKTVTDSSVLSRMHDNAKGKIVQIDLEKQNIPGEIVNFDQNATQIPKITNVLLNDKRQQNARWPNSGYAQIYDAKTETTPVIYSKDSNVARWTTADNMYIEGYMGAHYYAGASKVENVDPDNLTIKLVKTPTYGVKKGERYRAVNLLEELDIPGEWYIDKNTMIMYYYPPHELTDDDNLEIAVLNKNLVTLKGVKYISFEGITFAKTADDSKVVNANDSGGNGMAILDSENVDIKNCNFENIGMNGIYINGTNIHVDGCKMFNLGFNGIFVLGGDRNTLKWSGNVIENCNISNISLDSGRNQTNAIALGSLENKNVVGTVVKNNVLHNISNAAIMVQGNENQIINNEIYCAVTESSDAGAVYTGRSWTNTGLYIANNLFHNIGRKFSDSPYPSAAVYFDDFYTGGVVINNIMYINNFQGTSGIMFNAATGNIAENNTIIKADTDLRITGIDGSSAYFSLSDTLLKTLTEVDITKEPFSGKYPFVQTLKDLSQEVSKDKTKWYYKNIIKNNITTDSNRSNISEMQLSKTNGNDTELPIKIDMSSYVDPDSYDFRVTDAAKVKYNLPDGIIDESFDIDSIGIAGGDKLDDKDMEFSIIYPKNNDTDIKPQNVSIAWEKANLADVYEYTIAKDAEFNEIIESTDTTYTGVTLNLEPAATYYVKVTAKNFGRTTMCSEEAKVIGFTTSADMGSDTSRLKNVISEASAVLSKIREGDVVGMYMTGTKTLIKERISRAGAMINDQNLMQEAIDSEVISLKTFLNRIDAYENPGYGTLNITKNSGFTTFKGSNQAALPEVVVSDGILTVNQTTETARTNIMLNDVLKGQNVLKYKVRLSDLKSFFVMAVKQKNPNVMAWSDSCYYVYITPNNIEFQNQGVVLKSIKNDGIFDAGVWHEVEFGAVSTVNGVNFIVIIDGKTYIDYLDRENPQYEKGSFAIMAEGGINAAIEIVPVSELPDKFEISDKIRNQIEDTSIYKFAAGNDFVTEGTWNKASVKGYEDSDVYVSDSSDAKAVWTINGKNLTAYKVSFNNIKELNTEKLKIKATGNLGTYEAVIDLSEREEGFTELGVFEFYAQDYGDSEIKIEIQSETSEPIAINAIKLEEADINDNLLE